MSAGETIGLSHLADISGDHNVIRDAQVLAAYRIGAQLPAAAVRPGSEQEVAEIVKFAARGKLAIVVSGARTKLAMGMPPRQYDLALDMTRMNRVIAYDPQDLTLCVEPGAPLPAIADALAAHGQFLPLAVPFASRSTVGGTIASGMDSPLRQSYGTARDFVLGMQFVTGDGAAATSGGRVVKNVSGYDIHKMMIGSLGTLGVITRINFRTFPQPLATCTFVAVCPSAQGACKFRDSLAQSVLRPRTLETLSACDAAGAELIAQAGISLRSKEWAVLVSFAGEPTVLKRIRSEMHTLEMHQTGLASLAELDSDSEKKAMQFISEFPAVILERLPASAIFKIGTLPTDLPEIASGIASVEMPWVLMMRGPGAAYLALLPSPSDSEGSFPVLKHECARILSFSGRLPWRNVTLPWCPAALKRDVGIWGVPPASLDLMKKLKAVFDPGGILSPGRFLGGI